MSGITPVPVAEPAEESQGNTGAPAISAELQARNSADSGQMLSTVTGAVAANLITVLIIGLAFLEDRYFRISQNWVIGPWVTVTDVPHSLRWLVPPLWVSIVVTLLAGGVVLWWQLKKEKPSLVWVAFAIGVVTANVLAVVGYGAGLK